MDGAGPGDARRIWVVGPCGAGKSTVARTLATRLGVEPTHVDELFWRPGWNTAPSGEVAARLAEVVARGRWVIDGNYHELRAPHREAVELYVWLDLPLRVTWPRLLARSLRRSLRGEACCNGNRETLRRAFLHRDSILLYALTSARRRTRHLRGETAGRPLVRLRSQAAVDRWLAGEAPRAAPGRA